MAAPSSCGDPPAETTHWTADAIHPWPLIEALAARLPRARLHVIPGAAQLMYHQHLDPLLARVTTILSAGDG